MQLLPVFDLLKRLQFAVVGQVRVHAGATEHQQLVLIERKALLQLQSRSVEFVVDAVQLLIRHEVLRSLGCLDALRHEFANIRLLRSEDVNRNQAASLQSFLITCSTYLRIPSCILSANLKNLRKVVVSINL